MIKKLVAGVLHHCGYRLVKVGDEQKPTPLKTMSNFLMHSSKMGFSPQTVIDVGVATGTRALYDVYPDAFHLMIEPVKEFEVPLKALLQKHKGELVLAAACSFNGEIEIQVHPEFLFGCSILHEQVGVGFDRVARKVSAVTIDKVLSEKELKGPYIIKVDVQGAEIEVLEGAKHAFADTEMVLVEVSFFEFMTGCPQFLDVAVYMKKHGFVVYDFYGFDTRPIDDALAQCKVAFVKEHGMFRTENAYATADQWKQFLVGRSSC